MTQLHSMILESNARKTVALRSRYIEIVLAVVERSKSAYCRVFADLLERAEVDELADIFMGIGVTPHFEQDVAAVKRVRAVRDQLAQAQRRCDLHRPAEQIAADLSAAWVARDAIVQAAERAVVELETERGRRDAVFNEYTMASSQVLAVLATLSSVMRDAWEEAR